MKPSPGGLLLGVLIGLLVALVASGSKSLLAAPQRNAAPRVAPEAVPHPLWSKAVAVAARNDRWVARRFSEDQRVYDSDGELIESEFSTFAVLGASKKRLDARVLSSVKNGQDNKAAKTRELEQARLREKRKPGGGEDEAENPFAPGNQSRVRARLLGPEKNIVINGRDYRAFAFTQTTDEGVWDGVAWLDQSTGVPGRLVSTARMATLPKPQTDDGVDLRGLRMTVNYQTENAGRWRVESLVLELEITSRVAPLLTFEGRVRNTYRFSQYERLAG